MGKKDSRLMVKNVLVVGAGVAGTTLAYWLARQGIGVTVVEQAQGQRSSGSPVDVRGPALPVVEQMKLLPALREVATVATVLNLVDRTGRSIGWIPTQAGEGVEVPRSDLVTTLTQVAREGADFEYSNTVVGMNDDGNGVDVTFHQGGPRRFDLVVGADGLHSSVRRMVFGPESNFVSHLGLYIATVPLPQPASDPHTVFMSNAPGRAVAIHPAVGREIAAFIFRHRAVEAPDRSSRHGELVHEMYESMGWRVPELLGHLRVTNDLYFDSVSRVALDSWSRGRIVLVGDAASCVSLLGEGSSMAIVGAAALANVLAHDTGDVASALVSFENTHRKRLARRQRGVPATAHFLVPASGAGTAMRNMVFRLWPIVAGARRATRG